MKKINYIITSLILLISNFIYGQTPQNVTVGKGKGEDIWDSKTGLFIILAMIIILFISRNWSKKIQKKRDELSRLDKEEKEKMAESKKE